MKVFVVFAALIAIVACQRLYEDEIPIPYSFRYIAEGEEATSSHEETSDANGRKVGSYSYTDLDGTSRRVEYTADEEGFKAIIRTNEYGTDNQSPASVTLESSPPRVGGGVALTSAARPEQPRPRIRPISPAVAASSSNARRSGGVAYVLVPVNEAADFY